MDPEPAPTPKPSGANCAVLVNTAAEFDPNYDEYYGGYEALWDAYVSNRCSITSTIYVKATIYEDNRRGGRWGMAGDTVWLDPGEGMWVCEDDPNRREDWCPYRDMQAGILIDFYGVPGKRYEPYFEVGSCNANRPEECLARGWRDLPTPGP